MSLVDRANELEYVPEEQLIQMSQSPEGQYPQFLVLSEIQRRNQMRRMYKNQMAKMNQPTTTVAEESVMELAGQGAVPMMDSLSSLSSSEGGLRSMAPTPMKSGGITEMQSGGILGIPGDSLSQSFINPMEQQISNQELQRTQSILDMLPRNEDGSIDKSEIAKAVGSGLLTAGAVAAILIPEPTSSALGTARLASTGLGKNLFQLPGKIKSGLQSFMGKRALSKDPTKRFGLENTQGLKQLQTTKQVGQQEIKNLKIPTRLTGLGGLAVVGSMVGDEDQTTKPVKEELTEAERRAESSLQDLEKLLDKPTDTTTTEKQGFVSDDFLTLAQLGGILGGATNLGEAAMGIGNLAGQIQKTRRESGLESAQRNLLEAQAAKYIADVANMDLDNALQQYSAIPKLVESGVLTPEEAKIREAALIQRINEFQGTAANTSQKSYSQFVS